MESVEFRADNTPWIERDGVLWRPADMTATFGADVPWRALRDKELWLPVDCEGEPEASIGQLIERNSSGPLRLGFGAWRDLLLGCQFENGRGELITAGGQTVKNVAGYDLTKFMVGQRGIFGKIVAVTTRVYREPEDAVIAEFAPELELFNRLMVSACRPQWGVLTRDSLTCGYLGTGTAMDYFQRELAKFSPRRVGRVGRAVEAQWRVDHWKTPAGEEAAVRVSVPPMRIGEFAEMAKLEGWVADPAFGIVLARQTSGLAEAARKVGGRAGEASEEELIMLRRLKAAFDPSNQLSPLNA